MATFAVVIDAITVFAGFMLATWLRFDSGLVPIRHQPPDRYYHFYAIASAVASVVFLLVFNQQKLFVRPQVGSFSSKIPRIIRAVGIGLLLSGVLAFLSQNELGEDIEFARLVLLLAGVTTGVLVTLERYVMYRLEVHTAKHRW